jgi:predicted metalloprotease with PDZ domain
MHYKLSLENKEQHYLNIEYSFKVNAKEIELQFPTWRPGRYELGNFAKNIQKFEVFGGSGKELKFTKQTKDKWIVNCNNETKITVKYSYYSVDFNAGSTFVDKDVLYVNPVNCFIYVEGKENESCTVEVPVSKKQKIACGLKYTRGILKAKDYHQLVDSPFIVSAQLQKKSYTVKDVKFYVWFYGECKPKWGKVLKDFEAFTAKQIKAFGGFPVNEYHFINIIHPYQTYHGVEHQNSTVVTLGPSYDVFEGLYTEFLGVSSHELYHTWNIKAIRPQEMYPYDYSKENYSKLGYVAEGVTTYMGDLFLYESGVFDKNQYINEFNQYLKRHFGNGGRLNLSVADSSFDTWLDGYQIGIPDRKSSIYIEGALISFMIDAHIKKATKNKKSLHDVMKVLYTDFALKSKGYTEQDYKGIIEKISGENFDKFFNNYVWGTKPFEIELKKCLKYLKYTFKKQKSALVSEQYGLRVISQDKNVNVIHIQENSAAYLSGLRRGDIITAVNNYPLNNNFDKWLNYFRDDKIKLTVLKNGANVIVELNKINDEQFFEYLVS